MAENNMLFNEITSDLLPIKTGVPQGSILGPLLFVIYMNDIINACNMFKPVIYADDTALCAVLEAFGSEKQVLETNINRELNLINEWFKINRLSLNSSKTKAMIFHTPQKKVNKIKLQINDTEIEYVDQFDYLGIIFDSNMTWKPHLNKVSNKISRSIGVLNRLKHFLPGAILKTLYNSLIDPYLKYGIMVWGMSATRLLKLQKKAIRIISNAKYNAHTEPLFKNLEILNINDILKSQEWKFLYKMENHNLPIYFLTGMFTRQSDIHNYDTRYSNELRNPQSKHQFVVNSVRYRLPLVYNNCPHSIKSKISTHSYPGYSKYIKKHILNNYNTLCLIQNCYVCRATAGMQ